MGWIRRTGIGIAATALLTAVGVGIGLARSPAFKAEVKRHWRDFRRPPLPVEQTRFEGDRPIDPLGLDGPVHANAATLHFAAPEARLTGGCSPAIVRYAGVVSDSLIAISLGCDLLSASADPDARIVFRIDHGDGTPVEWHEKRLRAEEHLPGTWERFNAEWLLRGLPVRADDRIAAFVRGDEDVRIRNVDVVYRSAEALATRGR